MSMGGWPREMAGTRMGRLKVMSWLGQLKCLVYRFCDDINVPFKCNFIFHWINISETRQWSYDSSGVFLRWIIVV
jgi:hypothetical protein